MSSVYKPTYCYCCILYLQCCLFLFPGQSIPAFPACTQAPVLACYTHMSWRPQWCQNIFKLQSKFFYIPCLLINYILQYFVTLPHKCKMEGHLYCGMSMGAQGLTTFFPTHQPSLHGNTRYTHICSQPPIPTETQCSMQYATTCKHGNGTIYGHREREMGRGHRAGGWTDNHNIMQHPPVTQWVHWCTWLPNVSYSSISPSPWCCTHWPLETHVKTCRNLYLWVPVQVQVLTGMGTGTTKSTWGSPMPITVNTADKVKQGNNRDI